MDKATAHRLLETLKMLGNKASNSEERLYEVKKELIEFFESDMPFVESFEIFQKYLEAVATWAFSAGVEEGFLVCLDIFREMEDENAPSA